MQYAAFLRAINVAGHGRIKMDEVRRVFSAAGGANVTTYIQSGNVVFESSSRRARAVVGRAKLELEKALGETPEIMLRPMRRLADLVAQSPFAGHPAGPAMKCYVVFLSKRPRRDFPLPFVSAAEALEAIGVDEREVFLLSRRKANGMFGFPNNFIEKALDVTATSRNWSTIEKLVQRTRR